MLAGHSSAVPPDPSRTIGYGWIGETARIAEARGIHIRNALLDGGVSASDGIHDATQLDAAEFLLLCTMLINSADDELHGAGRSRMSKGTAAMGLHLLASARTLRAGMEMLARFFRMTGGFCDLELLETPDELWIMIRSDVGTKPLSCVVEEVMADWIYIQLCYVLQMPVALAGFVSTASHPQIGQTHGYFDCAVTSGPITALRLPIAYAAMAPTVAMSDRPLWDSVIYWLMQMAQKQELRAGAYHNRPVCREVLDTLAASELSIPACCEAMGVTERELRHMLLEEGSGFRELRRVALTERLRPLLADAAGAEDLAGMLGYSDARSMRRGLKLATGRSLSDLRRLGAGTAATPIGSPRVLASLQTHLTG